tara:strand:+ start:2011 stop:2304 length:294 start_codon:yes stop_codon:yes gene_type:complete
MTSENTYEDKKQEESATTEVIPEYRPLSSQEYNQRWKELLEGSGIRYLGTATQANEQRIKNGEPPVPERPFIGGSIGFSPQRRRQPTEETSKKEDTL